MASHPDFDSAGLVRVRSEVPDRSLTSKPLHGRSVALQNLLQAADRVLAGGASEFVLVSGPAGIGKSALVEEARNALSHQPVLFASGKRDQYQRGVPYSTLAQAFRGLVRQLLAKDGSERQSWRDDLLGALGPNGQLMIDLIPELAFIIGPQPTPPPADLSSAQARFHFVFRSLLGVFATAEHPLVLFIDDLQWLDGATLDLLRHLLTAPRMKHVLLLGAYRDDEVGKTHPLAAALDAIQRNHGVVSEIRLPPLADEDLAGLLADTLACDSRSAASLTRLVHEKTGGNPFFAIQFVRELAEDGSLSFHSESSRWIWGSRLRKNGMADNIAELMSLKLGRLPAATQAALGELALLGNTADLDLVALARGSSNEAALAALQPAIDRGLVVQAKGTFSFIHDQVQAAAYALVPPQARPAAHLRIGKLLLSGVVDSDPEDRVLQIAGQFDQGFATIAPGPEAESAARLYLQAGIRAKASSAYPAARSYFEKGLLLLGPSAWKDQYRLAFDLELGRAECEIVSSDLDLAEQHLDAIAPQARDFTDQAAAACLAVMLYFTTGRSDRAVAASVDFLSRAPIGWPSQPSEADVRRAFDEMHRRLAGTPVDGIADLPEMTDPAIIAAMSVMMELFPAAYAVDRNLMELVLLRMTNLSLEHGICESSSVAFAALNMAIGSRFGDYATACAFSEIARRLVDRGKASRHRARVYSLSAGFAMPWIKPLPLTQPLMKEAFRISSAVGDLAFAAYNDRNRITHALMMGLALGHVQHEVEEAIAAARKVELGLATERFFGQLRLLRKLRGVGIDATPDDDGWARQDGDIQPGLAMMICYHWVFRLEELYFAGDFQGAAAAAAHVEPIRWAMRSSIEEAEYDFYAGLSAAAMADRKSASPAERRLSVEALSRHYDRMAKWARNCPETFACREALLGAELARLRGSDTEAQALYEKAALLARGEGFIQVEAIANELASQFHTARGLGTAADAYLRNARTCYERWGCLLKMRQLDFRHPRLMRRETSAPSAASMAASHTLLDVEAVGRASSALSSEMELPRLIEKLMRLAVQHAGAERGFLLLHDSGDLNVEAEAMTEDGAVRVALARRKATGADLPQSVLDDVLRAQAPIVLDDSRSDLDPTDTYLQRHRPRSILCLPIFRDAVLIGILYVENRLIAGAFSPNRVMVLDFLASQAGIWLENARLYSDLQRNETWLREAQRLSRTGSFYWQDDLETFECSDEMFQICELDPARAVTLADLRSRVHPDDLGIFRGLVDQARASGGEIDRQLRLQMADRRVKHARLVAHSRIDRDGRRIYVGSLQDVTDTQLAQNTLGKVRSELAHVSRTATLGVLTASIAHEVNQPLLGIVSNATTSQILLAADPPNIEGAREMAQRCIRDGHRAAETIKRLRSLFGSKTATSELLDLNEIVREVLSLARGELQESQTVPHTLLMQDPALISGDRTQIQQVVLNLLMNAAEAMRDIRTSPRTITLSSGLTDDGSIRLDVHDVGKGFDPQLAERLFDAFYTTKDGGMGVGLSVSRSIIENLGGRLWAMLNDGPGATFSFSLPRVPLRM